MAIESVNVGSIANDGTGDDLREAFIKVNNNFLEVDTRLTSVPVVGENLGVGEGVYSGKVDDALQFKTLIAGSNITLSSTANQLTINASGGLDEVLVLSDNGSVVITKSNYLNIAGGEVIETRISGNNLFVDLSDTGVVERDSNPRLSSHLDADDNNIQNVGTLSATTIAGNLTGTVYGIDVRDINQYFDNEWDFGAIIDQVRYENVIQWIIGHQEIDMGPILNPIYSTIDLGTIS